MCVAARKSLFYIENVLLRQKKGHPENLEIIARVLADRLLRRDALRVVFKLNLPEMKEDCSLSIQNGTTANL